MTKKLLIFVVAFNHEEFIEKVQDRIEFYFEKKELYFILLLNEIRKQSIRYFKWACSSVG